jgi:hypothetical protein
MTDDTTAVKVNSKWGYIDKGGNYVISPQFDSSSTFYEGVAVVRVGGKWGYINRAGKYLINPQFETAFPFFDGYFSLDGKPIRGAILPSFDEVWRMSD